MLDFCDEVDDVARKGASANTLVISDGRVLASSTDGLAVTEAVEAAGARVLMLGAGGAAQAVATALLERRRRAASASTLAGRTRSSGCSCT